MRPQRGFLGAIGFTPMLWMGAALVLALGAATVLWYRGELHAERAQRWESAWASQAEATRRERLHAKASEVASSRAQRSANEALARARAFRETVEEVARDGKRTADPCAALLLASMCRHHADSLRQLAAKISRVPLPDAAAAPVDAGPGGAPASRGPGRRASADAVGR